MGVVYAIRRTGESGRLIRCMEVVAAEVRGEKIQHRGPEQPQSFTG